MSEATSSRRASVRLPVLAMSRRMPNVEHTHVWPRYGWEPPELIRRPVWLYPVERWSDPITALGPQHDDLRAAIATYLGDPPTDVST